VQATFEFNFISPRADVWHLGRLRRLFNQIQNHFAPRCALAGDLLLSGATKVSKSALYRRQLLAVLAGPDGVRCLVSGFVSRSFCTSSVFLFGARVTMKCRPRSLSERGCVDPAGTD